MSEIKIIKSENLTVTTSTYGGEINSARLNGKETVFEDRSVWGFNAPTMFPICGGLKKDCYIHNGREYTLNKHGFARTSEFICEKYSDNSVTYLLKSDESTKKVYPFDFELRITYIAEKSKITVVYDVTNTGNDTMYFSVGSHEAYACPEGVENYTVLFEHTEKFEKTVLNGNLLTSTKLPVPVDGNALKLSPELFEDDALVFENLKSKKATLRNDITGECRTVEFDGFDFFLLWQKPGKPYICMEPWSGCPDFDDDIYELSEKPYITALSSGKTYSLTHTITLE